MKSSGASKLLSNLVQADVIGAVSGYGKGSDGDLNVVLSETGEITFSNTARNLNDIQVGN